MEREEIGQQRKAEAWDFQGHSWNPQGHMVDSQDSRL